MNLVCVGLTSDPDGEYRVFLVGFLGKDHFDNVLQDDEREGKEGAADREAEVIAFYLRKRLKLSPRLLLTVTTDTCHGARRSSTEVMSLGASDDMAVFIDHVLSRERRVNDCKFHIGHLIASTAVEKSTCPSVVWARRFLSWLRTSDLPGRHKVFKITHCSTRFLSEVDEIKCLQCVRTFMSEVSHQCEHGAAHEKLRDVQPDTWLSLEVGFCSFPSSCTALTPIAHRAWPLS